MILSGKEWINKWSKTPFARIKETPSRPGRGTSEEPRSSLWLASLSNGMRHHFCEHQVFFDCGCGNGRYCNFLAERLKNFTYYGVEPNIRTGQIIEKCKLDYQHDFRVQFGYIDDPLELEALQQSNVIVMGSIFTHLNWKMFQEYLNKFLPYFNAGTVLVASLFIEDKYKYTECDRSPDFYTRVWYTWNDIAFEMKRLGLQCTLEETFDAPETHYICMIQKLK